ncbi:MAG: bifunctional metallophosphatase/5'-nucleotidase [Eubacteriales bacterium]|nr:bifunctional metallophosphatase/5'-nucleotidase [Eubacteriales bacterium]
MSKTLTIIQMNDTHANFFEHDDVIYTKNGFKIETLGGYPRLQSMMNHYREKYPDEVLLLDNGDTLHGSYEAVQSKGEVMIPYLRELGVDAMTFHWDAAYTPAHLKNLENKLGYPILAANVFHRGTKEHFFRPSAILEKNGLRIGVIGIASNIIQKNMPPEFSEGTDFSDGIEETRAEVSKLRQARVDLIVLLSHLGYPQDIELLQQVDGIDLCLSGHTHNRIRKVQQFNGAYIIQSGSLASSIGLLRLEVDQGIKNIDHDFIVLDQEVPQDQELLSLLYSDEILKKYRRELDQIVGSSKLDLHRGSSFYSSMDYLLLDAMREASGLPIAFSNGWRYGGAIKKGSLTRRDLYAIVPMDPMIRSAELSGQEIADLLEDNLEKTFSAQAFRQMGGYIKRSAGLLVYFKLENPHGQRIQRIFTENGELDPKEIYEVAYVTVQAVPADVGSGHRDLGIHAVEAMEQLLARGAYDREDLHTYIPV